MANTPKPHPHRRRTSSALEKKAKPATIEQVNDALASLARLGRKNVALVIQPGPKGSFNAVLVREKIFTVIGDGTANLLSLGNTVRGDTALDALANLSKYA